MPGGDSARGTLADVVGPNLAVGRDVPTFGEHGDSFVAVEAIHSERLGDWHGVVQEYLPFVDVAVSQQTGRIRATFEENSGLSPVIPIDRVEETIDELLAQGNDESLPSDT